MNRRKWMALSTALLAGRRGLQGQPAPAPPTAPPPPRPNEPLPLEQYQPKSMLHAPEIHVPRSRFPVIDFHTHITGSGASGGIRFSMDAANCLAVMDRKNIRTMVDLTGGNGEGLREAV